MKTKINVPLKHVEKIILGKNSDLKSVNQKKSIKKSIITVQTNNNNLRKDVSFQENYFENKMDTSINALENKDQSFDTKIILNPKFSKQTKLGPNFDKSEFVAQKTNLNSTIKDLRTNHHHHLESDINYKNASPYPKLNKDGIDPSPSKSLNVDIHLASKFSKNPNMLVEELEENSEVKTPNSPSTAPSFLSNSIEVVRNILSNANSKQRVTAIKELKGISKQLPEMIEKAEALQKEATSHKFHTPNISLLQENLIQFEWKIDTIVSNLKKGLNKIHALRENVQSKFDKLQDIPSELQEFLKIYNHDMKKAAQVLEDRVNSESELFQLQKELYNTREHMQHIDSELLKTLKREEATSNKLRDKIEFLKKQQLLIQESVLDLMYTSEVLDPEEVLSIFKKGVINESQIENYSNSLSKQFLTKNNNEKYKVPRGTTIKTLKYDSLTDLVLTSLIIDCQSFTESNKDKNIDIASEVQINNQININSNKNHENQHLNHKNTNSKETDKFPNNNIIESQTKKSNLITNSNIISDQNQLLVNNNQFKDINNRSINNQNSNLNSVDQHLNSNNSNNTSNTSASSINSKSYSVQNISINNSNDLNQPNLIVNNINNPIQNNINVNNQENNEEKTQRLNRVYDLLWNFDISDETPREKIESENKIIDTNGLIFKVDNSTQYEFDKDIKNVFEKSIQTDSLLLSEHILDNEHPNNLQSIKQYNMSQPIEIIDITNEKIQTINQHSNSQLNISPSKSQSVKSIESLNSQSNTSSLEENIITPKIDTSNYIQINITSEKNSSSLKKKKKKIDAIDNSDLNSIEFSQDLNNEHEVFHKTKPIDKIQISKKNNISPSTHSNMILTSNVDIFNMKNQKKILPTLFKNFQNNSINISNDFKDSLPRSKSTFAIENVEDRISQEQESLNLLHPSLSQPNLRSIRNGAFDRNKSLNKKKKNNNEVHFNNNSFVRTQELIELRSKLPQGNINRF